MEIVGKKGRSRRKWNAEQIKATKKRELMWTQDKREKTKRNNAMVEEDVDR